MEPAAEKELIEWFCSRCGDHIENAAYQVLLLEFANLISVISIGSARFNSIDDLYMVHNLPTNKE